MNENLCFGVSFVERTGRQQLGRIDAGSQVTGEALVGDGLEGIDDLLNLVVGRVAQLEEDAQDGQAAVAVGRLVEVLEPLAVPVDQVDLESEIKKETN